MSLQTERAIIGRLSRYNDTGDELGAIQEDAEDHFEGPQSRAGRTDFGPKTSASSRSVGRRRTGDAANAGDDDPVQRCSKASFADRGTARECMGPRPYQGSQEFGDDEGSQEGRAGKARTFSQMFFSWTPPWRRARYSSSSSEFSGDFGGRRSFDLLSHGVGVAGQQAKESLRHAMTAGLAAAGTGLQGLGKLGAGIGAHLVEDHDLDLAQEELEAEEKLRTWELIMDLRAIEYVGKDDQIDCFFAVTVEPENNMVHHGRVRLLAEFTPAYVLQKGVKREESRFCLANPYRLYERKTFRMSYKRLRQHVLKIAMWKVSKISFNTYVGVGRKCLYEVVTSEANMSVRIQQTLTQQDRDEMKKKRITSTPDVAVFETTVVCEEVFDFQLACENWLLEMNNNHPEYPKWKDERKCLIFRLPRDAYSNATVRRRCSVVATPWSQDTSKFFWGGMQLRKVSFRGTRTSLQNAFFVVMVHSANPMIDNFPVHPYKYIGVALMGLTSVLDISVFRGTAKTLAHEEERFKVAVLTGSIRCTEKSLGHQENEVVPGGRPQQQKSERTVSHLSSKEMHLVIRVAKCEGLAVGDQEFGTSDPFLRILWDNGVQTSPTIKGTLRPVYNFNAYFPVRFFNPKVISSPKYKETCLMFDLQSKGDITLQVWDDDGTSADYLGGAKVHMRQLLSSKAVHRRTLLGPPEKQDSSSDFEAPKKSKQWFEREHEVRVFDGQKTELVGCTMAKTETTFMFFEAYFYPDDWPDEFDHLKYEEETEVQDVQWRRRGETFLAAAETFHKIYSEIYPESIGAKPPTQDLAAIKKNKVLRRFPCLGLHPQTLNAVPLMAFLARIVAPEAYTRPAMLLHWMNCITFCGSESQEKTGRIPDGGWKDPQTVLSARKGSVQDHAVLLCSILLGHGVDAYVCKGTVWKTDHAAPSGGEDRGGGALDKTPKLVEHVWVMTRHEESGYVTFWESCNRELYHLPRRCSTKQVAAFHRKGATLGSLYGQIMEEQAEIAPNLKGQSSASFDARANTLDQGSGKYQPAPKAKSKVGKAAKKRHKDHMLHERLTSDIAPERSLLADPGGLQKPTLVDWLPYDSIEVVFNRENVWANRQNHHPACIMYNFSEDIDEQTAGWMPMLSKREAQQAEYKVDFISSEDVALEPESQQERLQRLENALVVEVKENMRLFRQKKGMDTNWDRDGANSIQTEVIRFLVVLEMMRRLDVDFCPFHDKNPKDLTPAERYMVDQLGFGGERFNFHETPFTENFLGFETYVKEQAEAWNHVLSGIERFLERRHAFPTKKGKVFRGFPIHFSTSDKDEVRAYLMTNEKYRHEVLELSRDEGAIFSIYCKMFALLGGVQSVWLYFSVQEPMEHKSQDRHAKNGAAREGHHDSSGNQAADASKALESRGFDGFGG